MSIVLLGKYNLRRRAFEYINPISNFALCATIIPSPQNFRNFGRTLSIVGLSSTISLVIPVSSVICSDISISGLTSCENLSTIIPSLIFTAPISVILSRSELRPVVSKSKTMYVPFLISLMSLRRLESMSSIK